MHFDKWLEDAESAIRLGSLADRVVLIIARHQKGVVPALRPGDKETLSDAINFFERAKQGFALLDQPSVNSNSRSFVSSFSAAARSLDVSTSGAAFVAEMGQLEDILARLAEAQAEALGASQLTAAREFFGRLAAEATDAVSNAVGRTPASNVKAWSLRSGS